MKNKHLIVRLEEEQKNKVVSFCRKNGITISEFMRAIILKRDQTTIKITNNQERAAIYNLNYQLQKIGVNINQIAHYLNLKHLKNLETAKSLEDVLIIDELKKEQLENIRHNLNQLKQRIKGLTSIISDHARKD